MAETGYTQVVKAYNDDPFTGHLSTPISDSGFTRAFINNLPIYRKGLAPLARGLEVGLAHGYFLVGPEILLGPGRDFSNDPYFAALLTAVAIIIIGTIGLNAHGLVSLKSATECAPGTDAMQTSEGWSQFASGFFLGGTGSAFMAYFLLDKFSTIDAIFRGIIN